MPNRLGDATSPYLLQHAENPVDWHEWGDAPFAEAAERDVPVILSVGYATCHWCHVMAHESFEDEATAAYMNEHFVNVKVDREERPDVDRIYMDAVTAMSGRGGWPMTVFLTPDAKPMFAGTYFPKEPMHGHPSFMDVLGAVVDAWENRRGELVGQADRVAAAIATRATQPSGLPTIDDIEEAVERLAGLADPVNGGFGRAPKFPQEPTLEFLLRVAALRPGTDAARTATSLAVHQLTAMAEGGIYDHLMGGFARYSVDARWEIPHFEKMLYDNAQLARLYLRAWQVTGVESFRDVAVDVLDWMDTTLADRSGGLHSGEDADSEGVEGKFCVWTWDELGDVLGDDRPIAAAIYGATEEGNFEGANNLTRTSDLGAVAAAAGMTTTELSEAKTRIDTALRAVRGRRVPPARDDKIVTAWNALALRAYAEAAAILEDERFLTRAMSIATFLSGPGRPGGELVRSWRGKPGHEAFADDLAATAVAMYTLFGVTGDAECFRVAEGCVDELRTRFADPEGGFFATPATSSLIARPKNTQDSPTPSDNALAMEALVMHAALTGDVAAIGEMESTMRLLAGDALAHPAFGGHALAVWLTHLSGIKEVAIVGTEEQRRRLAAPLWGAFRPEAVAAQGDGGEGPVPLLAGRSAGNTGLVYVCRDFVCDLPVGTPEAVADALS